MSPELIDPQEFGFEKSRPTRSSDCYALGMVIYETISGNLPFHRDTDLAVFAKVLKGERPLRGVRFTDGLWTMLELCWTSRLNSRPRIEDVLQCLVTTSDLPEPPPGVEGVKDVDERDPESASGLHTKVMAPVHQHKLRQTRDQAKAEQTSSL